jgi:ABC-2 type transport system permease protein
MRELRERLRSRVYKVSTIISVAAVVAIIVIPNLRDEKAPNYDVGLVQVTNPVVQSAVGALGPAIGATVKVRTYASEDEAKAALRDGRLDIALIEGRRIIVNDRADRNTFSKRLQLELGVSEAARLPTALSDAGLRPEQVGAVLTKPPLPVESLAKLKDRSGGAVATNIVGVIGTFIFIQTYGQWVLNGVAEEKASRIAEVLLAAIRPRHLVGGKVLGIGLAGLLQASIVAVVAAVAAKSVDVDVLAGAKLFYIFGAVGWFALGFSFYGWAFAAAGSLVSRQSEVGAAATPVFIPMMAGYIASTSTFGASDANALVRVLAYLPPTAPFCMPALMSTDSVAWWQVALAAGGVGLSALVMARIAGAIYANSILRAGKRIKWLEAMRAA